MALKALSKIGHSCMPNGLSRVGRGNAFRISFPEDMARAEMCNCMSAAIAGGSQRVNWVVSVVSE